MPLSQPSAVPHNSAPAPGTQPPPSLLRRILLLNQASNRFYWRWTKRPPYMQYYSQQLDACLRGARTAIHLGAGGKDPASLTSADLHKVRVYAVDPSPASLSRNPNPNKIVAWGDRIPLDDESIDVIFSEHVMEHVRDPGATFTEAYRLLRPGGVLLWVAPNLWSYSGLLTHLTPLWFHLFVNRLLEPISQRRTSTDVFPTYFRINSLPSIRRIASRTGFEIEELYTAADCPHYTQFLPLVHQLVLLVHIVLDRVDWLAPFRLVQIVRARKPAR